MGMVEYTDFKDMNSLMLVVSKIESILINGYTWTTSEYKTPVIFGFVVEITGNQCMIHRDVLPQYYGTEEDFLKLYDCRNTSKQDALVLAIRSFIKWHNKQIKLKCYANQNHV